MDIFFEKVSILGLGLLGGSMARAMKARGLCGIVTGLGRTPERLSYALANGIADVAVTDPETAVRGADLVVVATPVGLIPDMLDAIAPHIKPGVVVIDVGSTKVSVVEHAERVLPESAHFVGCHPMAGSENIGVEASTEILFENALCVVCAAARTEVSSLKRVETLWTELGARALVMSPQEHDLLVAGASHLPHVVAVSLCRTLAAMCDDNEKVAPLLAGGFRDTTRVASGSPEMWRDIVMANTLPISNVLDQFAKKLDEVRACIARANPDELMNMFTDSKNFRDRIPQRGMGALESEHRIIADVADRPGVLGDIAGALGRAGINLRNMNIQHVRELGGGTLMIVLEKEQDINRALALLGELGFTARKDDL